MPTGWTHVVLNYFGTGDDEGISGYYDGREVARDTKESTKDYSAGDGRIVVGRLYTNSDEKYASVMVDELMFFNQSLSDVEIEMIYNAM